MRLAAPVVLLLSAAVADGLATPEFRRCVPATPAPARLQLASDSAAARRLPALLRCEIPAGKPLRAPRRA